MLGLSSSPTPARIIGGTMPDTAKPDDQPLSHTDALKRLGVLEVRLEHAVRALQRIASEAIDLPHAKALAQAELRANAALTKRPLPGDKNNAAMTTCTGCGSQWSRTISENHRPDCPVLRAKVGRSAF
jgi:hypothetical protein